MRRLTLIAAALLLAIAAPRAERLPDRSERLVKYDIRVKLDSARKELEGTERLTWRNPSTDAVGDLWFHLYLNAFKNSHSTFVRESGGQLRDDRMAEEGWGWIDITSMKLADGTDLTSALRFEHPDDGNVADQTVASVPLPTPVGPGESVTLDIAFKAKLPEVFARTGYKRDFYLVGQWYPKPGVYEPAGMRGRDTGGWNCHQFHADSEFYADYGEFAVEFTVPSNLVVGATGVQTAKRNNGDGTTTYRYEQADVHDFAWTADPNFVVMKDTFSATRDVTEEEYARVAALLDRAADQVHLTDVDITVLMQPGRLPQAQRYVEAAKSGIKYFGLWYGRYPYRTLTIVDPAPGAGGAGGMEYPTFITAMSSFLLNRGPLAGIRLPEEVTIHEFGHQFWYGLVGSNEFEEAWLDEGFNSYSTGRIMDLVYGPETSFVDTSWLKLGELERARAQNSPNRRFDAILQPAWSYLNDYAFYTFQKPQLALNTLERFLGEETMARVMRTYHERWRFRHPSSEDFFAVANEISGRDLNGYFDRVVRGTDILDYEVRTVSSEEILTIRGVVDEAAGRQTISKEDAQTLERNRPESDRLYRSRVVVARRGEVVFPIEIAVKFEGRPVVRLTWDGVDRWKRFEFQRGQKLEWAAVDPDGKVLLDVDWLNNARRIEPDRRAASKWAARLAFWVQNLAAFVGF